MKNIIKISLLFILCVSILVLTSCGINTSNESKGSLKIYANGEDFVREGFVTKDDWKINFEHVYISLQDIEAYQTDPAYEVDFGRDIEPHIAVSLEGVHTLDLANGGEEAEPILIGSVDNAPEGHYNAISWKVIKASTGEFAGSSLVMIGTAEKGEKLINFRIHLDEEVRYTAGEFVGDERKGFVNEGGSGELELTFHFDHIFGDADLSKDDPLNKNAVGFEPFAALSPGQDHLEIFTPQLREAWPEEVYKKLEKMLHSLGHVGEGHAQAEEL